MKEVTFHLEAFDGPLDLLLHLLSKNKVDIRDIPIAQILDQYLEYIQLMQEFDLEVASEFITMAAQLMYIKSKMLLPVYDDEPEEDPRAGLVEALLEYQRIKSAGTVLNSRAELGRDLFTRGQEPLEKDRRAVSIRMTDKGMECYRYHHDKINGILDHLLRDVSAEDRATFERVLAIALEEGKKLRAAQAQGAGK